jgi:hypothetical protein
VVNTQLEWAGLLTTQLEYRYEAGMLTTQLEYETGILTILLECVAEVLITQLEYATVLTT